MTTARHAVAVPGSPTRVQLFGARRFLLEGLADVLDGDEFDIRYVPGADATNDDIDLLVLDGHGLSFDDVARIVAECGVHPSRVVLIASVQTPRAHTTRRVMVGAVVAHDATATELARILRNVRDAKAPSGRSRGRTDRRPDPFQLTARQHEIVQLLAGGRNAAGIARDLGISTNTVRTHIQAAFQKLGVSSQVEAVARARQIGLFAVSMARQ